MPALRHLPLSLCLPAAFLLLACGSSATTARPASPPLAAQFSRTGAAEVPDRFWLAFNDPALDVLVDRALRANPGLLAKWARLAQADALARRDRKGRLPTISASASGSASARGDAEDMSGGTSVGLGLAASYEVDLWGGIAASREATQIEAQASAADLRAAAISLAAEVASTWFDLTLAHQNAILLDAQLADAAESERLVNRRFEVGAVAETDALRQRQQVESLRGDREIANAQLELLENRLSVLLGDEPASRLPATAELPELPPLPGTGVPADMVSRRPDVLRTYLAIETADRKVAVAVADQFPTLKLTASAGVTGTVTELFANFVSSLVAGIAAPIIDGGSRKAEVERAREALIEKLHLYREVVLAALSEVEEALVREESQLAFIESLGRQLELASALAAKTSAAYAAGALDSLSVLSAADSLRSLERRVLAAERDLLEYRLALYRSLAGGWAMERPTYQTKTTPKEESL